MKYDVPSCPNGHPERALAKRIRAARAFAGISRRDLGKRVGLGEEQIGRYERGHWQETPRRAIREGIARACGVPDWFLEIGWDAVPMRREDAPYQAPPGELGRRAEGSDSTAQDQREDESQEEPGSHTGSE